MRERELALRRIDSNVSNYVLEELYLALVTPD